MELDPTDADKKRMQLTWTGERSSYASELRPQEKEMITDHTREIFLPKE
jgi:hypothetical protein